MKPRRRSDKRSSGQNQFNGAGWHETNANSEDVALGTVERLVELQIAENCRCRSLRESGLKPPARMTGMS